MRTLKSFFEKMLVGKVVRIKNFLKIDQNDPDTVQIKISSLELSEVASSVDIKNAIIDLPNGEKEKIALKFDMRFEILSYPNINQESTDFWKKYADNKNKSNQPQITKTANQQGIDSVLTNLDSK